MRQFEKRRKELNIKHRKDIRAAKMFLPVVVVLFICNIPPIVHYCCIFVGYVYRELYLGMLLAFTVNSAVNLPIYYLKGSSFRKEAKALLSPCCPSCCTFLQMPTESTTGASDRGGNTGGSNSAERCA